MSDDAWMGDVQRGRSGTYAIVASHLCAGHICRVRYCGHIAARRHVYGRTQLATDHMKSIQRFPCEADTNRNIDRDANVLFWLL